MTHYPSQSEADLALIRMIKECGGNRQDATQIMMKSTLGMRDKWKIRRDYRKMTLDKVFGQPSDLNQENDK
jgi:primase-polymerase (primpol)-like protein